MGENVELDELTNEIPLRISHSVHKSTISIDYMVYMQEHEFDVNDESDPINFL